LVPDNLDKLEELAERGVVGFKAFMCNSGIEDFPHVDDETLRRGMKRAASLKLPVAVHAESQSITRRLAQERLARGQTSVRDYLASRPIEAELEAIRRALELAGETGCALHVVHVSCGEGAALIAEARSKGVDVSCETCPHYLTFADEDLLAMGATAKCAPPLRPKSSQDLLWEHLNAGHVDFVASDHSPSPPKMKDDPNFFNVWGGIAGAQHTLPLLFQEGHAQRGLPLPAISRLLSSRVAGRFRLPPEKGDIKIGGDADLALVDVQANFEVKSEALLQRHKSTPYAGLRLQGEVVCTLARGNVIWHQDGIVSQPCGRLIKPVRK
jgi:allantoinase